jgi:hypothetical protein
MKYQGNMTLPKVCISQITELRDTETVEIPKNSKIYFYK